MNTRRRLVFVMGGVALAPFASLAQQSGKVWRIGVLQASTKKYFVASGFQKNFLKGMREHGYVPERDFITLERFADGDLSRLPALAAELVQARVDLILTSTTQVNRAAHSATDTIPIVTVVEADPVGQGFAVSLARPGKNVTGLSTLFAETIVKNFEFLLLSVPKLSRLAVLRNPSNTGAKVQLATIQTAATKAGVSVLVLDASSPTEIERAIGAMQGERVQAFIALPDTIFSQQVELMARTALKHRIPSSYVNSPFPDIGGLMSYGQDIAANYRNGARFIDRIFKGAKPGELPFEQPTTFELVLNLKTAQALGIKFPQTVLLQATRVIE